MQEVIPVDGELNDVKIIVRYGLHGFHKVFYSFCGIRVKSVTDKNGFT